MSNRMLVAFLLLSFVVGSAAFCADQVPTAAARAIAPPPGAVAELTELRTARAKHWRKADGGNIVQISARPVHYRDPEGRWRDINPRIGSAARAGFDHSVLENPTRVHFARTAGGKQAVEVDGSLFSFEALAAADSIGEVDYDTITYKDAWPNADLRLRVMPDGIKEEIVLRHKPSSNVFAFTVRPGGLTPAGDGSGGLAFAGPNAAPCVLIHAPVAWDARLKPGTMKMEWTPSREGTVAISLIADERWLETATYPVVLDPTVELKSEDAVAPPASYRSGMWSPIPWAGYDFGNCGGAYFQFDTSGIDPNATVTSSSLVCGGVGSGCCGCPSGNATLELRKVCSLWPTSGMPAPPPTISSGGPLATMGGFPSASGEPFYVTFTINNDAFKAVVQDWVSNPSGNHGVMIDGTGEQVDWQYGPWDEYNVAFGGYGQIPYPVLTVTYTPVIRVSPDGNDAYDGSAWVHQTGTSVGPKATVQDAIDHASSGGEVWVAGDAEHPYYECLTLRDGVALYGGFAGSETVREQRDREINETVLDANYGGPAVAAANLTSQATRMDGFTITHGADYSGYGGGIHCENSSITIASNRFADNTGSVQGGAIGCSGGAPVIVDNVVTATSNVPSTSGGGIYCSTGAPVIMRNRIEGCRAESGGGIYCDSSSARVSDNVLIGNAAYGCGGAIYLASGSPAVVNNTILDNTAYTGGGIYIAAGTPTIVNNIVAFNSSGLCRVSQDATVVHHNDVYSNGALNYDGWSNDPPGISVDPSFLPDGSHFHIPTSSPCADAGDDSVTLSDLDIDGELRVLGSQVDMGADETDACGWRLTITALSETCSIAGSVTITASLTENDGSTAVVGKTVTFSAQPTGAVCSPGSPQTGTNGTASTTLTSTATGLVTATATVIDDCGGSLSAEATVYFYDPNALNVDIFFCMDSTSSMHYEVGDHGAHDSIRAFLQEMSGPPYNIAFRVGGIKFNKGNGDGSDWDVFGDNGSGYTPTAQEFISLGDFRGLDGIYSWIFNGYAPNGGDSPELQLDALHYAAQDMTNNAVFAHKYIVLITDHEYHFAGDGYLPCTTLAKADVIDELTGPGRPPVYISVWDPGDARELESGSIYGDMTVNSGGFCGSKDNETNPTQPLYPLSELRTRIVYDLR